VYFAATWLLCCATVTSFATTMKPIEHLNDDEFVQLVQRAVALPEAPPALVRAAVDLWPGRHGATIMEVAAATVRLVSAVLSFDSWARPAVALGLRGAATDTRHLLFSAKGRDVDLRITPASDRYALTGQILGPDETGLVELSTHGADGVKAPGARVVSLDDFGEFRLDDVNVGIYCLTVRVGGDEIVLPPIEVGSRSP
jgi:hypothetical protein